MRRRLEQGYSYVERKHRHHTKFNHRRHRQDLPGRSPEVSQASGSAMTRRKHPVRSSTRDQNISRVLQRIRIPQKAGSTRCPMANTMPAINPAVMAWRLAPQMPPPRIRDDGPPSSLQWQRDCLCSGSVRLADSGPAILLATNGLNTALAKKSPFERPISSAPQAIFDCVLLLCSDFSHGCRKGFRIR